MKNPFGCKDNRTCPVKATVEHDIIKKVFFVIMCPDCGKVYMSGKGRSKLRVFVDWGAWKSRKRKMKK